jgi:cobalt/nickel transport system ATP-binding protein
MTMPSHLFNRVFGQDHLWEDSPGAGLYAWDPRLKLALLVLAVGANVIIARLGLSVALLVVSLGLAIWSRVPAKLFALFFLAPAWATLIVFLGFSAGFGITPMFSVGPLTFFREGMVQGLSAAARVACDMSWMAAVFLTTPFNRALDALKWFRVPAILLDTIAMTYRYALLLMDEFNRMKDAARSRGGLRGYRNSQKSTGLILAQVILRAYDRAGRIQSAMVTRGANASHPAGALAAPSLHSLELPEVGANVSKPSSTARVPVSPACPNLCDITPVQSDATGAILSCAHLSFGYGGTPVLEDISFQVDKGEVVVLCGPNGAGKSTLLKLLLGILTPTRGEISLSGVPLTRKNRVDAFRYAGLLTQDPNDQLFCTHVAEDIAYGPKNLGLEESEVAHLVQTSMELMEVEYLAKRPIHCLSYGEMKRVGLAGILALRPPLILLDEPTASLDPASEQHLIRLINHLNSHHGYTFVIVTHDINLASVIASRIIILNEGHLVADGPKRQILTDEKLLMDSRLEAPILTRLFQRLLGEANFPDDIPTTLEEAANLLKTRLAGAALGNNKAPCHLS